MNETNEIEPEEKEEISEKFFFFLFRSSSTGVPGRSLGGSQGDQREMNFFGIDGHHFAAYFGSVLRLHKERQEEENLKKYKYE